MKKVKSYLETLKAFINSEKAAIALLEKQTDVYTKDYMDQMRRQSYEQIQAKQAEIRKLINDQIDLNVKIQNERGIVNGRNGAEYQAQVSNILKRVQMVGRNISKRMLDEMLKPVIEKEDFVTADTIRCYVEGLGLPNAKEILASIPHIPDKVSMLENARVCINKVIDSNEYEAGGLKAALSENYLEQSGVFEI